MSGHAAMTVGPSRTIQYGGSPAVFAGLRRAQSQRSRTASAACVPNVRRYSCSTPRRSSGRKRSMSAMSGSACDRRSRGFCSGRWHRRRRDAPGVLTSLGGRCGCPAAVAAPESCRESAIRPRRTGRRPGGAALAGRGWHEVVDRRLTVGVRLQRDHRVAVPVPGTRRLGRSAASARTPVAVLPAARDRGT